MNKAWVDRLTAELSKPLPGVDAQLRLSPPVRRFPETAGPEKKSAVMIVLYPVNGEVFTVFIKRTEYKGVHSGQISLPGGLYKDSDKNLEFTALREMNEETGIGINDVRILGKLTPLFIPISNIRVFPYAGICARRPDFKPDPFEVKYIIETPVSHLLDPVNQKHKIMLVGENEIEIPYFDMKGDHLWGATAMMMSEFLEVVGRIK